MQDVNNFSAGKIALASPDRIRLWSRGEAKKQARVSGRAVERDSKDAATRVSWPSVRQFAAGRDPYGSSSGSSSGIPSPSPSQQKPFRGIRGSSPTGMAGGGAGGLS